MQEHYCVYRHTCPNGKVYIGITSNNPLKRWNNGNGYRSNEHFHRAILKYGWDNISHEILYSDISKDEACKIEKRLIELHKSNDCEYGYNRSIGGENSRKGAFSVVMLHDGKNLSVYDVSNATGISEMTIYNRLRSGWSYSQVTETPIRKHEHVEAKKCAYCGKAFKGQTNAQRCCSHECANTLKVIEHMRTCPTCGKKFQQRGNAKYCSKECYDATRPKRPIVKCVTCGREFEGRSWRKDKYCSMECRNADWHNAHGK